MLLGTIEIITENTNSVLVDHPIIVETVYSQRSKEELCQALSNLGFLSVPSPLDKQYLTQGLTKSVPTEFFCDCLISSGLNFVRLTHFGMKYPIYHFPSFDEFLIFDIPRYFPYPPNLFDISYSIHVDRLFTVEIVNRTSLHNVRIDTYPVFTPLDRTPLEIMVAVSLLILMMAEMYI